MNKNASIVTIVIIVVVALGAYALFNQKGSSTEIIEQTPPPSMSMDEINRDTTNPTPPVVNVPANTPPPSSNGQTTPPPATTITPPPAAAVKSFTVTGSNFKFAPAEIKVKKGDTVRITFNNTQGTHDWVLDEFNAKTKIIQGGQSDTVEFVATKTGTFEYYCSVGSHRQMGMVGKLIVE